MRQVVRKLRHWKQRFHKDAEFIWRRPVKWNGKVVTPGDPIPKELVDQPTKLRRFWESKVVELALFEEPNVATGQVEELPLPDGVTVEKGKGAWFVVRTWDEERKVNGQRALDRLLDELRAEAAEAEVSLVGSGVLNDEYVIGDETVPLGDIVVLTFEDTGLTKTEWNAMDSVDRENLLAQSLLWMHDQGEDEPEQPGEDEDGAPGTSEAGAEVSSEGGAEKTEDEFLS